MEETLDYLLSLNSEETPSTTSSPISIPKQPSGELKSSSPDSTLRILNEILDEAEGREQSISNEAPEVQKQFKVNELFNAFDHPLQDSPKSWEYTDPKTASDSPQLSPGNHTTAKIMYQV